MLTFENIKKKNSFYISNRIKAKKKRVMELLQGTIHLTYLLDVRINVTAIIGEFSSNCPSSILT